MANSLGGGTDRQKWKTATEKRMRGVGDLDFSHPLFRWVLEGGIKLLDRSTMWITSTYRRKSFGSLGSQRAAGIGPPERLGHREVEVVDEVQDTLPKIVNRTETGPLQQLANQDTEPNLNLIQP